MYDLLLRNGTLIDPTTNLHKVGDLGVTGSLISAVLDANSKAEARRVQDVSGLYVIPGFIDLHVHVFSGVTHYGVDVDPTCLGRGVTTALDAGSAGALTFPGFRQFIIDVSETRLFALLNISALGLVPNAMSGVQMGELEDLRYVDVKEATRVIEANRDKILGVKIRLSDNLAADGENEMPALLRAREAADAVGLPLMIHTPLSSLSMKQVLNEMRLACWLQAHNVIPESVHEKAAEISFDDLMETERRLNHLRERVLEVIANTYGAVDGPDVLNLWKSFIDLLSDSQPIIPIFTTNYDWAIEEMAIASGKNLLLVDGFTGERGGRFDCSIFDKFDPGEQPTVCLFKLHGSTSWYEGGDGLVKSLAPPSQGQRIAIRYPGSRREVELGKDTFHLEGLPDSFYFAWYEVDPFRCLFNYLSGCLAGARLVVAIGYQFGDDEINERLRNAFELNANLEMITMLPGDPPHITGTVLYKYDVDDRIRHVSGSFGQENSNEHLASTIRETLG